jgi:hypothetical protein
VLESAVEHRGRERGRRVQTRSSGQLNAIEHLCGERFSSTHAACAASLIGVVPWNLSSQCPHEGQRPSYFATCRESIQTRGYSNWRQIVSIDPGECVPVAPGSPPSAWSMQPDAEPPVQPLLQPALRSRGRGAGGSSSTTTCSPGNVRGRCRSCCALTLDGSSFPRDSNAFTHRGSVGAILVRRTTLA